jgi:phytanoyl-CoA dioxygenase PhyH
MLRDVIVLLKGAKTYAETGLTPVEAAQSLINLHCRSRGYSNDILHGLLQTYRRPYRFPHSNGILGNFTSKDLETIASGIRETGYYIFPNLLPSDLCDRLVKFALSTECKPRSLSSSIPAVTIYNRQSPIAERYDFAEQNLMDNPDIQALVSDLSILSVAQSYLGSQPILDIVTMWWSTTFSTVANSEAAQLYHFDMDRIKWIKFFFYLTDVTPQTGPHCYIAKSHRRNGQPGKLLQYGYARIPDEEIARCYPKDAFVEMTGPCGTIIAEDTRGFHKGKVLESGDRLVLQFEFCDSLFGAPYTRSNLESSYNPHLFRFVRKYRRIYSKFVIDDK